MSFQIITDSSWDMGPELAEKLQVEVIPFFIAKDGEHYQREVEELPVRELYQFMVDHPGVYAKTAQPSIEEYIHRFENSVKAGKGVLCCVVNQKFSGSYNAALLARQEVLEKYPEAQIRIIDTRQATLMQGMMVQELAFARDAGRSLGETAAFAEQLAESSHIFFTVSGMDYLIHGGRVGKLAGMTAEVLNLCPMIVLAAGELKASGVARGRKAARRKALQMLISHIKEHGNDPDHFRYIVGHGYDIAEGDIMHDMLKQALQEEWPGYETEIRIGQIGAAIGVHTGPYPIGFGIVEKCV